MQEQSRDEDIATVRNANKSQAVIAIARLLTADLEDLREQLEKSYEMNEVRFIQGMIKQTKKLLTITK